MSVQFSELHTVKGRLKWSPNGELLATTEHNKVMIRSGESLQILAVHSNLDVVDILEWSYDSKYVLCGQRKRGIVQVWSVSDPRWEATIDEGLAGLSNAKWTPSNCHIITVCEFQIRVTVWNLNEGTAKYIKFPKFSDRGIHFSHNGKWLAIVERVNHRDVIGIYSVQYWHLIQRFPIETSDLYDIRWSPTDQYIVAWDNPLEYRFVVYNLQGKKLAEYKAYENALGIKSLQWSPNGVYLAVGSYDQVTRVFNTMSWRIVANFKCTAKLHTNHVFQNTIIYEEQYMLTEDGDIDMKEEDDMKAHELDDNQSVLSSRTQSVWNRIHSAAPSTTQQKKSEMQHKSIGKTKYSLGSLPCEILSKRVKVEENPKVGIGKLEWSHDSRFIAVVNDNMEECVWIWDMKYLTLHSLLKHLRGVNHITWSRDHLQLACSCNNDRLYIWGRKGSVIVRAVASRFNVKRMYWRPQNESKCVCLVDKDHFCCCYELQF